MITFHEFIHRYTVVNFIPIYLYAVEPSVKNRSTFSTSSPPSPNAPRRYVPVDVITRTTPAPSKRTLTRANVFTYTFLENLLVPSGARARTTTKSKLHNRPLDLGPDRASPRRPLRPDGYGAPNSSSAWRYTLPSPEKFYIYYISSVCGIHWTGKCLH